MHIWMLIFLITIKKNFYLLICTNLPNFIEAIKIASCIINSKFFKTTKISKFSFLKLKT